MRLRPRAAGVVGVCALGAAVLTGMPAASGTADGFRIVTLRHQPTRFSIRAPQGFKLDVRRGVYILRKGAVSVSFSRSVTSVSPGAYGTALLQQLGGRVVLRAGDRRHFVAQLVRGPRREHLVVERIGSSLAVTTSASTAFPVALETLRAMGLSARGGISLRAPKAGPQRSIPLRAYRAPDGGATAQVPAGNGWDIQSSQGSIQGASTRGAFLFGFSFNVPLKAPPNSPPSFITSPYLNAVSALVQLFPRLAPTVSSIRVRRVLRDAVLPTFSSSGMLLFDYRLNGKLWTGVATVATDSPDKYSNFLWNFYYSGVGVPAGTDPSVGVGLLRAWRSWNPSCAIAARAQQARVLLEETNEIWRQTNEFRSQTADRQSRDVGCLLQGYYVIEDDSRRYNLPPLPCGQLYTERG